MGNVSSVYGPSFQWYNNNTTNFWSYDLKTREMSTVGLMVAMLTDNYIESDDIDLDKNSYSLDEMILIKKAFIENGIDGIKVNNGFLTHPPSDVLLDFIETVELNNPLFNDDGQINTYINRNLKSFKVSYTDLTLDEIFWHKLSECVNLKELKITKWTSYGNLNVTIQEDKIWQVLNLIDRLEASEEFLCHLISYTNLLKVALSKLVVISYIDLSILDQLNNNQIEMLTDNFHEAKINSFKIDKVTTKILYFLKFNKNKNYNLHTLYIGDIETPINSDICPNLETVHFWDYHLNVCLTVETFCQHYAKNNKNLKISAGACFNNKITEEQYQNLKNIIIENGSNLDNINIASI